MGQDRDDHLPLKSATAIGYSIISNLGGDRQMTVQCFVGEDEPDAEINRRIDKVFRVLDRQKAKYDLDKLEKEFEEVALHTRNFLNAIPMADRAAKAQMETLKATLLGQQEARKEVFDAAYKAHVEGGRRGSFKPTGATEGRLRNMDTEIAKTVAAIEAQPKDNEQHRQQTIVNVAKYQDDMKKRRLAINDLRHMAGKEPYTLFMDEQEATVEG